MNNSICASDIANIFTHIRGPIENKFSIKTSKKYGILTFRRFSNIHSISISLLIWIKKSSDLSSLLSNLSKPSMIFAILGSYRHNRQHISTKLIGAVTLVLLIIRGSVVHVMPLLLLILWVHYMAFIKKTVI